MTEKKTQTNFEIMSDPKGFFRDGERQKIYDACDTYRNRVLVRLLWKSGRRVSEILDVKVSDIDFENGNILWDIRKKNQRKRKKSRREKSDVPKIRKPYLRWKPIDKKTLNLLAFCIKSAELKNGHYLIFSLSPEKPLSRQRVFQIVRSLCKKANVKGVGNKMPHPHHFRHSFAVDIAKRAKSPADIRKLQLLLEHSNLEMTQQYLQFGAMDLRELIEGDYD